MLDDSGKVALLFDLSAAWCRYDYQGVQVMARDNGKTAEVLKATLTENTGRHMLDSGGAYGRHWERNQGRDFDAEPRSRITFSKRGKWGEIDVTHSTYHFLLDNLSFSQEWQDKFDAFVEESDADKTWLTLMDEFCESVGGESPFGGRGSNTCVNTYNEECLLDQTLQYCHMKVEDEDCDDQSVVLLQIHGGCDVRGGYTAPKLFTIIGDNEYLDVRSAYVYCSNGECEDGRWYSDGSTLTSDEAEPLSDYLIAPHGQEVSTDKITFTLDAPLKGAIYVDEKGKGYCPCCAKGTLDVDFT